MCFKFRVFLNFKSLNFSKVVDRQCRIDIKPFLSDIPEIFLVKSTDTPPPQFFTC